MSAKLPVILSPGNDLIGELSGVRCGWFLADDRPETAVGAIREFATAAVGARSDLGREARDWVCRELPFELFQTRLRALAREAVSTRRTRG